jgi:hypothetical protein
MLTNTAASLLATRRLLELAGLEPGDLFRGGAGDLGDELSPSKTRKEMFGRLSSDGIA